MIDIQQSTYIELNQESLNTLFASNIEKLLKQKAIFLGVLYFTSEELSKLINETLAYDLAPTRISDIMCDMVDIDHYVPNHNYTLVGRVLGMLADKAMKLHFSDFIALQDNAKFSYDHYNVRFGFRYNDYDWDEGITIIKFYENGEKYNEEIHSIMRLSSIYHDPEIYQHLRKVTGQFTQ